MILIIIVDESRAIHVSQHSQRSKAAALAKALNEVRPGIAEGATEDMATLATLADLYDLKFTIRRITLGVRHDD